MLNLNNTEVFTYNVSFTLKDIAKKGIHLGMQGIVDKEQALKETEDKSDYGYELFGNHPNKEKHRMQQFIMQNRYGWGNKSPQVAKY